MTRQEFIDLMATMEPLFPEWEKRMGIARACEGLAADFFVNQLRGTRYVRVATALRKQMVNLRDEGCVRFDAPKEAR